jgi:transcriptional regulator with XRE-family HTH domain
MASHEYASAELATSMGFGPWLRQLREQKGVAQRAVAAAANMDSSHYGKVEGEKRLLTDEQAVAVARFLGVTEADMRARQVAARFLLQCDGDHALAVNAAGLVQEAVAPYLVNNHVAKPVKSLRPKK